jgi:hypothetical protein
MDEFKGTQGEWEYEVDLDYDQGGNSIGLGPVVEVNGEVILKGITRDGTVEGCNFKDVRLAAAAPDLLSALLGVLKVADRATDEFDAARAAIAKALGQ